MKKMFLLSAVFSLLSLGSFAQIFGYGPKAGVVFSHANGFPGATDKIGVVGGVFGDCMLNDWFAFQTEVLFTQQGWDAKYASEKLEVNLGYLKMPVLGKFYLIQGLNLQLGAQFDFLVNAKVKIDGEKFSIKNQLNRFSVDFLAGLAYEFNFGLILEGRYTVGLTPLQNAESSPFYNVRNGALQFTAGWRF